MFNNAYISKRKTNNTPIVTLFRECRRETDGDIFTHMHYHDDFEILYILDGTVKMIIDGETVTAEKDSIILVNPYETHYGEMLSDKLTYYCLDFDMKFLSLTNEEDIMAQKLKYINHIPRAARLLPYIAAVHDSYTNEENAWEIYARGNMLLLFYFLSGETVENPSSKKVNFEKTVIDYIGENYMNSISSADAATLLDYNHNYFCRAFKRSFGCRFADYLNGYRVRRAQELLITRKISEVSGMVGFSSINYFSVVFKKITGISPSYYKKQYK